MIFGGRHRQRNQFWSRVLADGPEGPLLFVTSPRYRRGLELAAPRKIVVISARAKSLRKFPNAGVATPKAPLPFSEAAFAAIAVDSKDPDVAPLCALLRPGGSLVLTAKRPRHESSHILLRAGLVDLAQARVGEAIYTWGRR